MYKLQAKLHKYFVCVDCGSKVTYFPLTANSGYFLCKSCHNIHLRQNKISIFLPKSYENKQVFGNFLKKYASKIKPGHLGFFVQKNQDISKNIEQNWENDDVIFWNKRYLEERGKPISKSRTIQPNLRDVIRKAHLFDFVSGDKLKGKIVCEIGTGEARTIRHVFSPSIFPYYYVPTDYSFEALLLLKRLFAGNKRVYYIQCLGEHLPFPKETIDYLVILGVLHHMPKKGKHIKKLIYYIRKGGQIFIEEPYLRNSTLSDLIFKHTKFIFEPEHSSHEERPKKRLLLKAMENAGNITHIYYFYSPILTLFMLFFNRFSILRKDVYINTIILLDQLCIETIGRVFPMLDSGECVAIIKRVG